MPEIIRRDSAGPAVSIAVRHPCGRHQCGDGAPGLVLCLDGQVEAASLATSGDACGGIHCSVLDIGRLTFGNLHGRTGADTEQVADPVGRVAAEMISPYPPGVPAILPGERFNQAVVTYLRAGKAAGMTIPDASDPDLNKFRVVRNG